MGRPWASVQFLLKHCTALRFFAIRWNAPITPADNARRRSCTHPRSNGDFPNEVGTEIFRWFDNIFLFSCYRLNCPCPLISGTKPGRFRTTFFFFFFFSNPCSAAKWIDFSFPKKNHIAGHVGRGGTRLKKPSRGPFSPCNPEWRVVVHMWVKLFGGGGFGGIPVGRGWLAGATGRRRRGPLSRTERNFHPGAELGDATDFIGVRGLFWRRPGVVVSRLRAGNALWPGFLKKVSAQVRKQKTRANSSAFRPCAACHGETVEIRALRPSKINSGLAFTALGPLGKNWAGL